MRPNLPSFQNFGPMCAACRAGRATLTAWVHTSPNQILLADFQTTSHANGQDFCNSRPNSRHSGWNVVELPIICTGLRKCSAGLAKRHLWAIAFVSIAKMCQFCQKSSFFVFQRNLSRFVYFCCVFFAHKTWFCGDLKTSSNTVAARLYQNIFSTFARDISDPLSSLPG